MPHKTTTHKVINQLIVIPFSIYGYTGKFTIPQKTQKAGLYRPFAIINYNLCLEVECYLYGVGAVVFLTKNYTVFTFLVLTVFANHIVLVEDGFSCN